MENKAHDIVLEYIRKHLDKSDEIPQIEVYTVWKCKALQNWKFLISSSLLDGMYYELTFNGDKNEWYLDAYKKFENQVIPELQPEITLSWANTLKTKSEWMRSAGNSRTGRTYGKTGTSIGWL